MPATPQTKAPPSAQENGQPDPMAAALAYETAIAEEASTIRGDATELDPALFMKLWPLLKRPIPQAFIQTVPKVEGKPYASTGIRSVQVQIDRMNNVLTPMWWWEKVSYADGHDGKLAHVTVCIGSDFENALLSRRSAGGVERGSTTGNIYKGSYTNAAKLAFARIGVGHEVYLGATDLDPDVSEELAGEAGKGTPAPSGIGTAIAKKLVDRAWALKLDPNTVRLAASHAAGGNDVGDCSTKPKAQKALAKLSFEAGEKLDRWLTKKADERTVQAELGGDDGGK